ncbi:hypothetical protein IR012_11795 [Pseudomonas putida]|uniref:hypothetical protein n=1 Tax=Pseudomonas putida TaxID=303 RepID=UPI0018AA27BA|nr:hypothetical protein [Pseudomonas putida]MBF8670127.1 hypothetical protein [Pseudomonas putida]MBF8712997.1 hypothetical protein [Pseudomonas putida]
MDADIQARYARSFRGKLYMRAADYDIPLRLSRNADKLNWGFTPEDDWLQAGGRQDSPVMDFHYHSHTDDRLHYHISIPGRPETKKLGISRNGYLGFYWHAEVTDYWKIEPLQPGDEGLVCHLSDHRGYRVGAIPDTPHHSGDKVYLLNVEEGEIVTFLLRQAN